MSVNNNANSHLVRFGIFEANLQSRELFKQGMPIRIPEQSFALLALLLGRPGEVITRDEVIQALWGGETFVDFDQSIGTAVGKLRRCLNDSADDPRYVETIRQRGFRLLVPILSGEANLPVPATPQSDQPNADFGSAAL